MKILSKIESYLSLLNEFCNKQMFLYDGVTKHYEKLIAKQLVANFDSMEKLGIKSLMKKNFCLTDEITVNANLININDLDSQNEHLLKAVGSFSPLIKYSGGSFYFYGSVASADSIDGWSDIDSMLIIENPILYSVKELIELRHLVLKVNQDMRKMDPLQHHGILIQPKMFLDFHPDTSIPFKSLGPVLSSSKSASSIKYRTINTDSLKNRLDRMLNNIEKFEKDGVMKHHPFKGEYLLSGYKNRNNCMYQLKYYIGLFTIIPSYVAQIRNEDSYKPLAIASIKEILSKKNIDWLNRISELRKNWNRGDNEEYIIKNIVPPQVYEYIPSSYFEDGAKFSFEIRKIINK